jgi:magnesium and cobalt exporter, CNNM family
LDFNTLFIPFIFLFGAMLLTAFYTAFSQLGRFETSEFIEEKKSRLFFFNFFFKRFLAKDKWKNLYFTISSTKHILLILYASFACILVFSNTKLNLFTIVLLVLAVSILADISMRFLASMWARVAIKTTAPFVSIILTIFFPIIGIFLHFGKYLYETTNSEEASKTPIESKMKEMIKDSEFIQYLEPYDQKLINSLISFRKRVAREVMIPRIDIVSIPINATLAQATSIFLEEEYSRVPIYKDSLDEIIGVLLYKDLLIFYAEQKKSDKLLNFSIQSLLKPVIYSPENKKISHLLQEFRSQQIHLAVVVDEYGGTEGIITIEDILEEIVGEIEDEYDVTEEEPFTKLQNNEWLIDAKMSIIDIESKLGISIPHNPEYETIGGYVFHRAGTIPSKGWKLHHDKFELEIISSSERCINKIRIIPTKNI